MPIHKITGHRVNSRMFFLLFAAILLTGGCSGESDSEIVAKGKSIKEMNPFSDAARTPGPPTGNDDSASVLLEGSGTQAEGHPGVQDYQRKDRVIRVPSEIEGKWKAVKVLVRNKTDEEQNEIKTVDLGSSFTLGGTGLKVTVGPFFPNLVMDDTTYTSIDNQPNNPAVHLVVEEKGKIIYKGWAFSKYPKMYAFEHPVYGLVLVDFIPTGTS